LKHHDEEFIRRLDLKAVTLRKHIIEMLYLAKSGHPGGSLSAVEAIVALYFHHMHHDPKNPHDPNRDRFVLSKGHAAPALYAALAECGYFDVEELKHLRQINCMLQGHPVCTHIPGVEASTGSLGHGLSFAVGIALAGKLDKRNYRVYVMVGDGETNEGQIWEAATSAAHYKLDNLTALIDRNFLQIDGNTEDVLRLESVRDRWSSFGWHVIEVDGHDIEEIIDALLSASEQKNQPTMIILNTVKGKGVSFM
jgi:transketolase